MGIIHEAQIRRRAAPRAECGERCGDTCWLGATSANRQAHARHHDTSLEELKAKHRGKEEHGESRYSYSTNYITYSLLSLDRAGFPCYLTVPVNNLDIPRRYLTYLLPR